MIRTLTFEQIQDDRFNGSKECLLRINTQIFEAFKGKESVIVTAESIRELEFYSSGSDGGNTQWRQRYFIQKTGRQLTWNDVYKAINKIKAVPYSFTRSPKLSIN